MAKKKYVSLSKLTIFLEQLKQLFAQKSHKHMISDVSDYKIDSALSDASNNPVTNKVIKSEFDSITSKIETNLSISKAYADSKSGSALSDAKKYTDDFVAKKSLVQIVAWGADD